MQKVILYIGVLFFLSSCCTTRICKIERAEKKISKLTEKYPELLDKDTIILKDTITINDIIADTSFIDTPTTDTIIITKDKLTIRYIKTDSIIYLEGNCEGDTIYITNEVPVETIVVRELTWREKAKEYTYLLFAIAALLLVIRIFFKDFFKVFKIFK